MSNPIFLLDPSPILSVTLISLLVVLTLLVMGWVLRTRYKVQLGFSYNLFCIFVAFYLWLLLSTKYGLFETWDLDSLLRWYAAIMVFFAAWFGMKVFSMIFWDLYLLQRHKKRVPGLVRSVVTVFILVATLLLIFRFVFDMKLSGLLVASSVTAAILIFALQDFLGGLVAGITMSLEPPFQVGDWVELGDKEGEVVDISWRATTLRTLNLNYLVIPNSMISRDQITNFYKPTRLHALVLTVGVEYGAAPTLVKETLISCALETEGVLPFPRPVSRLINYGDFAITYDLKFFIEDHSKHQNIRDGVMTRIWYNLARRNIRIPFPIRDVFVHEAVERKKIAEETSRQKIEGFLRRVHIFEPLDEDNIQMLASAGRIWSFGKGERIVKQGEVGNSLFLILEGQSSVNVKTMDNGREIVVGNLAEGDFFGEKSLLTGEPRSASVIALTDIEVMEIAKENLVPILENNPSIMEEVSKRLAERQLALEDYFKDEKSEEEVAVMRTHYSSRFLNGIKSFFGI